MSEGALTVDAPVRRPLLRLLPDTKLARLAAQGSTPAFTAIYERHHQALYRYCRSILRDDDDARDALQNTMIKALRGLEGESREIDLRPWLFRIAHNESISVLRRRPADSSLELAPEVASTEADPETRERLRNLIVDLDQLAPRQKSALVMRELSGLGFSEIAAALETSPAAAKQAVYEARLALHELEEGRELSCDDVCRTISEQDRRLLRGRRVRAHLKSCTDCSRFAKQMRQRGGQLAMLAPPLPLTAAAGILSGILGGGGGGGGIAALTGGGVAGIGAAAAAKLGVAGVIVLGAAAVAIEAGSDDGAQKAKAAPIEASGTDGVGAAAGGGPGGRAESSGDRAGRASGGGGANRAGGANRRDGSREERSGVAAQTSRGGNGAVGDQAPSASPDTPATPAAPSPAASSPGSNGNGPASTPPGQGGVPPGQGGVPPGLGAPPPGQGGPSPGQSASAPGQTGTAPGQGVTPPAPQVPETPPGNSGGHK